MGKRQLQGPSEGVSRKKRKVLVVHEEPSSEEIHTTRQLVKLLAFDQDLKSARHALQSFKLLLDTIANDDDTSAEKLRLLEGYLQATKPKIENGEAIYLSDIMETWSLAAQLNNDNIMSAAAVVLALLLRIVSTRLHLVPSGLGLGRTLLQPRQRGLIATNLSADKGKEFVISPTLRLLREVLALDGGALAGAVFRARSQTFAALARNLGIRYLGDGVESAARPSARTNAVRFLLAALRFLPREAKREILGQRDLVAGITRFVRDDPPHLVLEILGGLRRDVLLDEALPRDAKARLLTAPTLSRVAGLYGYDQRQAGIGADEAEEGAPNIPDLAHEFLMVACTMPSAGLLRKQSGFYPKGMLDQSGAPAATNPLNSVDDWAREDDIWVAKCQDDIPVSNTVLSDFIQSLRPWSSVKQSELVVSVFQVAPELIAKYFLDKRSFSFEPKLSATWIGYAAFLFATAQVSIPPYFGLEKGYFSRPPPSTVVLDNILPPPLNQKVLSRCFSLKSNLTSFFATRLLVLSLKKLQTALDGYAEAAKLFVGSSWQAAARELLHEFCQRVPPMKDVVNAYRAVPSSDFLQRETLSRLLRLYYDAIPQVAMMSNFDVSPLLAEALQQPSRENQSQGHDRAMSLLELNNLLAVARFSPGVRWFAESKRLSTTPFVAAMRVCAEARSDTDTSLDGLGSILGFVAEDHQLVVPLGRGDRMLPYLHAIRSTTEADAEADVGAIYSGLDKAVARCAASPLKYLIMLEDMLEEADRQDGWAQGEPGPLLMAMAEQLPFLVKQASGRGVEAVFKYLARLAELLFRGQGAGESRLRPVFARMGECLPEDSPSRGEWMQAVESAAANSEAAETLGEAPVHSTDTEDVQPPDRQSKNGEPDAIKNLLLSSLPTEPSVRLDNAALTRWTSKEAEELIDDGDVVALVRLLASEHESIRKEALTNLLKMAAKINESDYPEKVQIWLLLKELAESARDEIASEPLPWTIVAFASHSLDVLNNPLHDLYPKVNTFLIKGPIWALDRLPLLHEVCLDAPAGDDTWYGEVSFLLQYLLYGLQTSRDLAIFHKRRVYERLCGLVANPYLKGDLRMQVFRILWRTSCLAGGSTTLITRFGIISWLQALRAANGRSEEGEVCGALLGRIWETCDQERVRLWSNGGILGDEFVFQRPVVPGLKETAGQLM